jgi:hypothetical protein
MKKCYLLQFSVEKIVSLREKQEREQGGES